MGLMQEQDDAGDLELVDPAVTILNISSSSSTTSSSSNDSSPGRRRRPGKEADPDDVTMVGGGGEGDGVWSHITGSTTIIPPTSRRHPRKKSPKGASNVPADESYYTRGDWVRLGILFVLMTTLVVTTIVAVARKKHTPYDEIATMTNDPALSPASFADQNNNNNNNGNSTETAASKRAVAVAAYINQITLTGRTLRYPPPADATTEEKALQWVIDQDPAQRRYPDEAVSIRQRYALALFWFQDSPIDKDGNYTVTWTDNEFGSLNGNYTYAESWLTALYECSWTGVFCDDMSDEEGYGTELVTYLSLFNSALRGVVSVDIGVLPALVGVDLHRNALQSPVPWTLASLRFLQRLDLGDNLYSERVPGFIGNITSLEYLSLASNDFVGTIPSSYQQNLVNLTNLLLYNNRRLDGPVPDFSIFSPNLESLRLYNCSLSGTLPRGLFNMTLLSKLDVSGNAAINGMLTLPTITSNNNSSRSGTNNDTAVVRSFSPFSTLALHGTGLIGSLTPLCDDGIDPDSVVFSADCDEVNCPCCRFCCPWTNNNTGSNETEMNGWIPKVQCDA